MVAEMKIVPLQRLAIGVETFHNPLLNRERAGAIVASIENHRWTLDLPRGVARMARSDSRRWLVSNRRVVSHKGAYSGRCGNKMDSDAPAHAVADHAHSRGVDVVPRANIAPASIDHPDKI